MMRTTIDRMITQIIDNCLSWIKKINGKLYFVDPIDGVEISAHYGATHMATALIIYGDTEEKNDLFQIGIKLLNSVLERWSVSRNMPGFHNDFNNFALCVTWKYLSEKNRKKVCETIKKLVLDTQDSNNPTVNWFPMRWYVNQIRYEWTNEQKYLDVCKKCKKWIKEATYSDGFIDDRLPKGLSFNLQYDVATVAVMQYLNNIAIQNDISVELGALINAVAPDGDINYLGRGTNQVFAWGVWIYLLASAGKNKELEVAELYLLKHLTPMLKNNNMMLNDYSGKEKYLWWDYHYCSVYTAHLLLWLVFAKMDYSKYPVTECLCESNESGINIYRADDYFVSVFKGRKEYFAERGPVISALWTKSAGMICKGNFGPWQGAFGNEHTNKLIVPFNNLGLLEIKQNRDWQKNRYIRKLLQNISVNEKLSVRPMFSAIKFSEKEKSIEIEWHSIKKCAFIMPLYCDKGVSEKIDLYLDSKRISLYRSLAIRNQYDLAFIFQSKEMVGNTWKLSIQK